MSSQPCSGPRPRCSTRSEAIAAALRNVVSADWDDIAFDAEHDAPLEAGGALLQPGPAAPAAPKGFTGFSPLAAPPPGCDVLPTSPFVRSNRFFFASEVGNDSAVRDLLAAWVAGTTECSWGVLVLDRIVHLSAPIVIPKRFTLMGLGQVGAGGLWFDSLPNSVPAITFQAGGWSAIRNLQIVPPPITSQNPIISVTGLGEFAPIVLSDVNVYQAFVAVSGSQSARCLINRCTFDAGGTGVQLGAGARSWRIRSCYIRANTNWAISAAAGADDLHVLACRMEYNQPGAIQLDANAARIAYNRFESNPPGGSLGIQILADARNSNIVCNYGWNHHQYASPTISAMLADGHRRGFNIGLDTSDQFPTWVKPETPPPGEEDNTLDFEDLLTDGLFHTGLEPVM